MKKAQIAQIEKLGEESRYQEQANFFLEVCNVRFEAREAFPQTSPDWAKDGKHGIKWTITLAKAKDGHNLGKWDTVANSPHLFSEIVYFDFWGSIAEKERSVHSFKRRPTAYDVLAGIDNWHNDTFEDWCFNYGYDEDSREAYRTYQNCEELAAKLSKVFTREELEALQYIQ